jgi:hypothetical protein
MTLNERLCTFDTDLPYRTIRIETQANACGYEFLLDCQSTPRRPPREL